jgi:DNA-directed RNA polymerase III subunit RPC1
MTPYFMMQQLKGSLPKVVIKGIKTVARAIIAEQDNTAVKSYKLLIEGTDMRAAIGTRGLLGARTTSNHIMEVEKTLGIEAARFAVVLVLWLPRWLIEVLFFYLFFFCRAVRR